MDEMRRLAAFLYGFAPRSALVCSGEGDPPSGDGGGGQPAPQPNPTPAPAQPAPAPQFTPEQLAFIEEQKTAARNAGAADARRAIQGRQQPKPGSEPPQPQPPPPNNPQPPPQAQAYDAEALSDELVEFPFDKEQRAEIRAAARRENPDDVGAFVAKWARMFGKAKAGAASTPNGSSNGAPNGAPAPGSNPAPPNSGPPITSRGTPPPAGKPTADTPILSMSEADRRALAAEIGDIKFAERYLKELARDNVKVRPRLV